MLPDAVERRIQRDASPTGCWLWKGALRNGYGRCRFRGRTYPVHRVTYELLVGPIVDGAVLDHTCRVRHCVNPEHLEPVSIGENVRRGEGPSAQRARRTHCCRGHALAAHNLILSADSAGRQHRRCRTCANAATQRRHQRADVRPGLLQYWKTYNATRRKPRLARTGVPS